MSRIDDYLTDPPADRQWLVAAVGVALTGVAVAFFEQYGQAATLLAMVTTILPAVALVVYGGWFWLSGGGGARSEAVVAWALVGAALMFALERWTLLVDAFDQESAWRVTIQHTSIGALGGAIAGTYAERARWRAGSRLRLLHALDATMDGIAVLDEDGTIQYANDALADAYGSGDVLGRHWHSCYPEEARGRIEDALSGFDGGDRASWEGTVTAQRSNGTTYPQDLSMSALDDGYVWVCRDVTSREERDQRLRVLNRVLRHNVRNALNVVLGRADRLRDRYGEDEDVASIVDAAEDLLDASEKARRLERSLSADAVVEERLDGIVDEEVERVRGEHPGTAFEVDADCEVDVDDRLRIAVRELVENAAEHCDADQPRVTVAASEQPPVVRVDHNGAGIPEQERRALAGAEETPLEHGSGLGLWLVYWVVTGAGGDVEVDEDGAVVLRPASGKN